MAVAFNNGYSDVGVVGDGKSLQLLFEMGQNQGTLYSFEKYVISSLRIQVEDNVKPLYSGRNVVDFLRGPVMTTIDLEIKAHDFNTEFSEDLIKHPLVDLINPGHRTILEQLKALNTQIDKRKSQSWRTQTSSGPLPK